MVEWIVQIVLVIAGAIADWFIVRDSPNFDLVQMTVGILLVILVVAIAIYSPFLVRRFRTRRGRKDSAGS
jgi:hypothetical protein